MTAEFLSSALRLAIDVPARSSRESSAWTCRGLAEVALMMQISKQNPELLDRAVQHIDLSDVPERFASRLRGLRLGFGEVPPYYPYGTEKVTHSSFVADSVELDAMVLSDLADLLLFDRPSTSELQAVSALNGVGERAFYARAGWRPEGPKNGAVRFQELIGLDPALMWRGWMTTPSGVVMVVADERLDPARMDLWWGVHNGTHLDHLLATRSKEPNSIEFGRGLLIAEALAMSAELLAGVEAFIAKDTPVCCAIGEGLVERIGRLRLPERHNAGDFYRRAVLAGSEEFSELPVLSEAYVVGPLNLIRARHADVLIPRRTMIAFEARWEKAAQVCPVIANFIVKVRGGAVI